jgi:cytochrome c oxidase assembly protein subunit 15
MTATAGALPAGIPHRRIRSAVRAWLVVLAALVVAMVAVGGATRLTGSGLSITEWKPVTGAIPPLSEKAWAHEFDKYRQIPQYELVNKGMSLSEFKTIYFWEWGHRQLGRFLGAAFFIPRGSGSDAPSPGVWRSRSWESERWEGFKQPWAGSWWRRDSSPA